MVVTSDPTVYPCGRGVIPGSQGQGSGGSEPPIFVILVPNAPDPPDPPFIPSQPKPGPRFPTGPAIPVPQAPPPPADPPTGGGPAGPTTGGPARPITGVPSVPGPTTGGPARPTTGVPPAPPLPGGPTTGGPGRPTTGIPRIPNTTVVSVDELIEDEDFRDIQKGIVQPVLFDPNLNFFSSEPTNSTNLVTHSLNPRIFANQIVEEIAEIVSNSLANDPWNEITLQSLSDDNLLASLNPNLIDSFVNIRYPGGELVGLPTMLNVVRKHILQGTLDEFDPSFYTEVVESQESQGFQVLEQPSEKEQADRLAINYLINRNNTYQTNKSSPWRNFQINRVRPLNEDVKLEINVTTLDGTVEDLSIPNEGIQVDKITALDQITVPSIGAPDKLNIGNGGGYYIDATDLQAESVAVPTDNIIPDSYYAPSPTRIKVLDMLQIDPSIKITASSLSDQHEFVSGDIGASAAKPLFFGINLSSVIGDYASDSLVENYSATYSLITASSDIQVHLNNNALNVPMLCVDYRDPIYRYILDTSSFTASLSDFNLNGFRDKGFSSIGSRFVRNIPFGFVVTPVAGGRYNPFYGNSKLDEHGNIHVRSISVMPATDATVDGSPLPMFRAYSLNLEDGVNRVGIAEQESTQNIGYRYFEEDFTQTFYSASARDYGFSSVTPSAQGTAYMLREVVDYLSSTYSATTVTWYDIFSRMPITKVGEMFYDSTRDLILEIANGLRSGVRVENIESGYNTTSRILPEDSKTIVTTTDRRNVTKVKI